MILTETVQIRLNYNNKNHFKELGYDVDDKKEILVDVKHLNKGSHVLIKIKCDICGIEKEQQYIAYMNFLSRSPDNKYRCGKCNQILRKKTNIEKYGEDSPMKVKEFKDKWNKTVLDKYGVDHPCKNEEIKNKIFNTNLEKYGVKYIPLNNDIQNKIVETNYKKYGGIRNLSSIEERKKIENIMLEKYGFKYSSQIKEIRDVIIENGLKTRIRKIKENYSDIIDIIGTEYTVKCDCGKEHNFIIDSHNFYNRMRYKTIICTVCNPVDKHSSGLEKEFVNFVKNNFTENVLFNNRNVIFPQEIDVYFSDLKIGFEFNGLYWHSNEYKDINYHKNKIKSANEMGIKLFHIYDDDWKYKKDIIKNDIKRIINPDIKDINEIIEIEDSVANVYNENNNLYGHLKSTINICGIIEDNIVSMMSIKKNKNYYEIVRLTGDDNFEQLFKYFLCKYNPTTITGSVNKDWDIYDFYEKNSFSIEKETEPDFQYIIKNKKIKGTLFENQIPKIYDSGKIYYKFKNKI